MKKHLSVLALTVYRTLFWVLAVCMVAALAQIGLCAFQILQADSQERASYTLEQLIEQPSFALHDIYRALSVLAKENDYIQAQLYKNSQRVIERRKDILYYDCTNYFFELEEADELRRYGKSKQLRFLNGHPLIPIGYVQTRDAQHKKKTVNRYTPEGRAEIHKNLGVNTDTMIWLMRTPVLDKSIEFADNRISLFAAQYGRCAITGAELMPYDIRCHHKVPLENGGTDKYSNLVLVTEAVHLLIHATLEETIQKYLKQLQLNKKQLEKLNKLRKLAGTPAIV